MGLHWNLSELFGQAFDQWAVSDGRRRLRLCQLRGSAAAPGAPVADCLLYEGLLWLRRSEDGVNVHREIAVQVVLLEDRGVRPAIQHKVSHAIADVDCASSAGRLKPPGGLSIHTILIKIVASHVPQTVANRVGFEASQLTDGEHPVPHNVVGDRFV